MSSVEATIKQGGSEGSAVNKVMERTSVRGLNRKPPFQTIAGGIDKDASLESSSTSDTPLQGGDKQPGKSALSPAANRNSLDSASDGSDVEEDGEFNVINPLFVHAGGNSNRFRAETDYQVVENRSFAPIRLIGWLQEKYKVPDGRLSVSVLHVSGLKNAGEARIRFSLNGQVDWSDHTKKMFDLAHYKSTSTNEKYIPVVGGANPSELAIEINELATDSFWGSASLADVDKVVGPTPKKFSIPIFDVNQISLGDLEVTLTYHEYNLSEIAGMRWKWLLDTPRDVSRHVKHWAWAWSESIKQIIITGLPGMQGGAASWVVFGALTIPFILVTLLTKLTWATRQWFLVIPIYLYLSASLPVILGWLLGTMVTVFAMFGYSGGFHCGALHITPWIKGFALQLRITALELGMGNPPGFPLENFWHCKRADVAGFISFRHLIDFMFLRYKRCPLRKVPDFRLLALWDIDYIEVDEFTLDFIMYKGKFNVWELSHLLADSEARQLAWAKGLMKADEPMPNELEIRIIRAKNLVKTRTSKRSLRAQNAINQAASGPLGRNAVFDAFLEDESGDEADEEESLDGDGYTAGRRETKEDSLGEDNNNNNTFQFDVASSRKTTSASLNSLLDEEERRAAQAVDQQKRKYRGLGPPQFNPMDATLKRTTKQGHFDPYVVVQLRRDVQKTKTQTKTNSPMWNERFHFHVTDAATVIHVQVFNREVTQDQLLGQWVMTLKHLLSNPKYCWHEKGIEVTKDRWIRGWFPLMNKNFRGIGRCGKLEMALQWRFVPETSLKRKIELPPLSALAQLQENSEESRLRMGDMGRIKYWLNHEPFLFDVKRMSVFNFKMYLQDIFLPGPHGEAEKKGVDKLHYIHIPRVDWLEEFRPKKGDPGITIYSLLYRFFAGIAPKVMNTAQSQANVTRTIGVIAGAAVPQIKHGLGQSVKSLWHGGALGKGLMNLTKSTDRALQLVHRNVTVNKDAEMQFKVPVDADDEDFLLDDVIISGHLARYATKIIPANEAVDMTGIMNEITDVDMERESRKKGAFRNKYFELKGRTLFFRRNRLVPKGNIYGVTYKIPLSEVVGAIHFVDQDELMLNMPRLGIVTRLRKVPNEIDAGDDRQEEDESSTIVGEDGLDKWIQALKACGVPCFTWKRSAGSKIAKMSELV